MQTKKDDLLQAILSVSEEEFFNEGYKSASLRRIAKKSGTTIGNLYHYFASKEALFDSLVKGEYEGFIDLVKNHKEMANAEDLIKIRDIKAWRKILKSIISSLFPLFSKRFYILLNCSKGTRYEKARSELQTFLESHFTEHLMETRSHCTPELGRIISEQLLSSILAIIRDYDEDDKKSGLIAEILLFTILGVMGMMEV